MGEPYQAFVDQFCVVDHGVWVVHGVWVFHGVELFQVGVDQVFWPPKICCDEFDVHGTTQHDGPHGVIVCTSMQGMPFIGCCIGEVCVPNGTGPPNGTGMNPHGVDTNAQVGPHAGPLFEPVMQQPLPVKSGHAVPGQPKGVPFEKDGVKPFGNVLGKALEKVLVGPKPLKVVVCMKAPRRGSDVRCGLRRPSDVASA